MLSGRFRQTTRGWGWPFVSPKLRRSKHLAEGVGGLGAGYIWPKFPG